jgi:hypothetical protein
MLTNRTLSIERAPPMCEINELTGSEQGPSCSQSLDNGIVPTITSFYSTELVQLIVNTGLLCLPSVMLQAAASAVGIKSPAFILLTLVNIPLLLVWPVMASVVVASLVDDHVNVRGGTDEAGKGFFSPIGRIFKRLGAIVTTLIAYVMTIIALAVLLIGFAFVFSFVLDILCGQIGDQGKMLSEIGTSVILWATLLSLSIISIIILVLSISSATIDGSPWFSSCKNAKSVLLSSFTNFFWLVLVSLTGMALAVLGQQVLPVSGSQPDSFLFQLIPLLASYIFFLTGGVLMVIVYEREKPRLQSGN